MIRKDFISYTEGRFHIESTQIELIWRRNNHLKISGCGNLERRDSGEIWLTILSNSYNSKLFEEYINDININKIIGEEDLFDLYFLDINGNIWQSNNLVLNKYMIFSPYGNKIECKVDSIFILDEFPYKKESVYTEIFISRELDIPLNCYEHFLNGGFDLNHCKIYFNNNEIIIKKEKNFYLISIYNSTGKESLDLKILLHAISVAIGQIVTPLSIISYFDNKIKYEIYPIKKILRGYSPISTKIMPRKYDFNTFILGYIESLKNRDSELFGRWYNVCSSYSAGFDIFATEICLAIEGIAKYYLNEYGLPTERDIIILNQVSDKVKTYSEFSKDEKNIIISSINARKQFRVINVLKQLLKKEIISEEEIKSWSSLRNKLAHSDSIENSVIKLQKLIFDTNNCFTILIKLIFFIIQYQGLYIDYNNIEEEKYFPKKSSPHTDFSLVYLLKKFIFNRFLKRV